ncbi:hypothetical protein H206_05592 [Candidatus Electrothrix aarhusensis]|uniref:Uncharacterized protein n=1 Tax=Candidatus Electrothrix aarhusensis TaxID=1859131 RepID=A0A444J3Z8_9BACT|nr:hypothetical protein H206_05592 [Candidatus Electrothrix aarhusensis]
MQGRTQGFAPTAFGRTRFLLLQQQRGLICQTRSLDFREVNFVLGKEKGGLMVEQTIDCLDHRGGGAVIGGHGQAILRRGVLSGLDIGEDICPAKTIDGLFGITDQEEARFLALCRRSSHDFRCHLLIQRPVDSRKNTVLKRISILKLIHHDDWKTPTDASG